MKDILNEIGPSHFLTLLTVWSRLAPNMPVREYFDLTNEHRSWMFDKVELQDHGTRLLTPEEIAQLPDNSADYEDMDYRYRGVEEVQALAAAGKPLVFLTWHNGALQHGEYGISRLFPQTALFTRHTQQYGKICSYPMEDHQVFSLVRMERFLSEGRPILHYLDGPPFGKTEEFPLLGVPSKISTAPIELFRSIEELHIVPVTRYYRNKERVETIFHTPLKHHQLESMTTPEIVRQLLSILEQDQQKNAPEQACWRMLLWRAQAIENPSGDEVNPLEQS
jgi:lauroyl/myristoyl acyltransferase